MPVHSGGQKTAEQLEKIAAKEDWFKLVVKIINWKDGNPERGSIQLGAKITNKEWNDYTKGTLANNLTYGRDAVIDTLKNTKQIIKDFGGFE
jgi:hypothetical protein